MDHQDITGLPIINNYASGEPTGKLADDLKAKYGDFQSFMNEFETRALGVFGSGWAWLMPDLTVSTTPNQDSPMNNGTAPLLGLDVWEHAYYLDYTFNRADYVKAWWNVVNWQTAAERYKSADDTKLVLS